MKVTGVSSLNYPKVSQSFTGLWGEPTTRKARGRSTSEKIDIYRYYPFKDETDERIDRARIACTVIDETLGPPKAPDKFIQKRRLKFTEDEYKLYKEDSDELPGAKRRMIARAIARHKLRG